MIVARPNSRLPEPPLFVKTPGWIIRDPDFQVNNSCGGFLQVREQGAYKPISMSLPLFGKCNRDVFQLPFAGDFCRDHETEYAARLF